MNLEPETQNPLQTKVPGTKSVHVLIAVLLHEEKLLGGFLARKTQPQRSPTEAQRGPVFGTFEADLLEVAIE